MEILGSFIIFSYSRKWNWTFPILSVPYWLYWAFFFFFFLDIVSEALQLFVKIFISRKFSFFPVNNIHNICFKKHLAVHVSSLSSGMYSSPFLWKILLSCSHAVHKCSASWHQQESPGCWGNRQRNPSRNILSLPGFSTSAPLTQAIWQGKQTGRWDKIQDERMEKSRDRNKKAAGGRPKAQSKFQGVYFCCLWMLSL